MEDILINLINIKKHFNISIEQKILEIFKNQEFGFCFFKSNEIVFYFENKKYSTSIYEIFNEKKIIKVTKDYLNQIKRDKLPKFPDNSFIFGEDIGGDYFVLNCSDNNIYFCGEVTFYNFVNLKINIFDFLNDIEKTEISFPDINFKLSFEEIKILNKNNNKILSDFLNLINYGINDIKIQYIEDKFKINDSINFIYGFEYLHSINNEQNNKYFYFGETLNNKKIILNTENGDILLENNIILGSYLKFFK